MKFDTTPLVEAIPTLEEQIDAAKQIIDVFYPEKTEKEREQTIERVTQEYFKRYGKT